MTTYVPMSERPTALDNTPPGKRTVRANIWGNIVGYVSGKRHHEFGVNDSFNRKHAKAWAEGREATEWWNDPDTFL